MAIPGAMETGALVERIFDEIMEALDVAADETSLMGERHAKRLAPVRKVSYLERNKKTRALSRAEVASLPASIRESAQAIQRRGGTVRTTVRRSRQILPAPEVTRQDGGRWVLKNPGDASALTYRGRQELAERGRRPESFTADLRTGQVTRRPGTSAIFTRKSRVMGATGILRAVEKSTLGGRLRGEIRAIKVPSSRGIVRYDIISPTPYARFVEFPTSRTAAQPYMRPTLKYLKRIFLTRVFRELRQRGFRTI